MSDVGKNERNPRQEEIPDQPGMPVRFAVCDPCHDKPDTYGTCGIEQGEHGNIMPVPQEEITESV
jgi:hypothetical protein